MLTVATLAVPVSTAAAASSLVPLQTFHSPSRGDFFITTDRRYTSCPEACPHPPDYEYLGTEGYIYSPDNPQPAGTVALYSWYNERHKDNFATTDPRDHSASGYRRYRKEGYLRTSPAPTGTRPLYSSYSKFFGDKVATAGVALDGSTVHLRPKYGAPHRREGYVLVPDLVVTQLITTGPSYRSGRPPYIVVPSRFTVLNRGLAPAEPFFIDGHHTGRTPNVARIYPTAPLASSVKGLGCPQHVVRLRPGAAITINADIRVPAIEWVAKNVLAITADGCLRRGSPPSYRSVLESDEANNTRKLTVAGR